METNNNYNDVVTLLRNNKFWQFVKLIPILKNPLAVISSVTR